MDSMLRWIRPVLVLVLVSSLQHSDADLELKCTVKTAEGELWENHNCQTTSDGLEWIGDNSTLLVYKDPPVSIRFSFEAPSLSPLEKAPLNESICTVGDEIPWDISTLNPYASPPVTLGTTVRFDASSRVRSKSTNPNSTDCNLFHIDVQFNGTTTESYMESGSKSSKKPLILGLSIGGGLILILILGVVIVMRRRVPWHRLRPTNSTNSKGSDFSSVNDFSDLEVGGPRLYTYKDLSSATHGFSSKYVVGEGGFGTVYKGVLKESRCPVAIKRLSQYARQGAREFIAEVQIISQLRHRNLVQLLGWCYEKEELILVYEFMPNGDLDDLIYAEHPKCDVTWTQRYNILCGVATALVYLHEEWVQRVVHRDVKTSNVMLDSNLNARLGDFGLARLSAHSQAPQSTLVAGTLGYLAPEFSTSGKATDKTDVYAFGVVALEVTCAKRPLSPDLILVDWVWNLHKQDKLLDAVEPRLDPKLRSTDDEVQMKIVLQVGLLCCHPDPEARPTMRHVLNMLKGEASVPRVPRSKPVASYFEDD